MLNSNVGKEHKYTFMKLSKIKRDTLFLYRNTMSYNSFSLKLDMDDYFSTKQPLKISKADLQTWLKNTTIVAVERNYNRETGFYRVK